MIDTSIRFQPLVCFPAWFAGAVLKPDGVSAGISSGMDLEDFSSKLMKFAFLLLTSLHT